MTIPDDIKQRISYMNEDQMRRWYQTPINLLKGRSPLEVVTKDGAAALLMIIEREQAGSAG
jgi:hypothetical protein